MDKVEKNLAADEKLTQPEPINVEKILGDSSVLFVSDDHTSLRNKDVFKDFLTVLRTQGVTELFLEMLPNGFDTENEADIKKYLATNWDKRPGIADKYFEVISHAKTLGMKVIGIDIPASEYQSQDVSESFRRRNDLWAKVINDALSVNENSKGVVFHGSAHAGYYPAGDRANNILTAKGRESRVARLLVDFDPEAVYTDEDKRVSQIRSRDPNKNFMLPLDAPSRSADFLIYIH